MKLKFIFIFIIFFLSIQLFPQDRITTEEYIETYKDVAIKKMKEYKIPASITLAQGILESGSGNSRLATKANNHFGIKCHKGWTGKTFTMDDDAKNECFRKYKHASDSYRDHSEFLTQRGRYSFLFEYGLTDYKSWAKGLKKAGYATNPKYPELLIRLIEKHDLSQYDKGGKGKKKVKAEAKTEEQTAITLTATSFVENLKPVTVSSEGSKVYENNGIRFIVAKTGDTYFDIADEFNIYTWQLFKYNELDKKHIVHEGEFIYLEKKKKKADKQHKIHIVRQDESLHGISQYYGVRASSLMKRNKIVSNRSLSVGISLKLR